MNASTKPTLAQFQQFARDVAPAARAVLILMARVFAQMERARVDAYILPIFERYQFTDGLSDGGHRGQPITTPAHLYLSTDEAQVAAYFEECDRAHRAHGFCGPQGHCPALTAENLVVKVERALIELATPLFGVEPSDLWGDTWREYVELLIGAALKAESEAA